jgi:hypothetical protein
MTIALPTWILILRLLESAYPEMLEDLPTWQIRTKMKILTQMDESFS